MKKVERTPEHVARWARRGLGTKVSANEPYALYNRQPVSQEKWAKEFSLVLPHNVWMDWELEAVLFINDVLI